MPHKLSMALGAIAALSSLALTPSYSQAAPVSGLVIPPSMTGMLSQKVGYQYLGQHYPICTWITQCADKKNPRTCYRVKFCT